jgi:hypothetical protein
MKLKLKGGYAVQYQSVTSTTWRTRLSTTSKDAALIRLESISESSPKGASVRVLDASADIVIAQKRGQL